MLFSSMGTHLRFYFLYFVQSQPITRLMDVILLELFLHVNILKINPAFHMTNNRYAKGHLKGKSF